MFSYTFWQKAIERALKTFSQTLVAVLGAGGIGFLNAPWATALSTAGMAAALSLLTSVSSAPVGARNDPCLIPSAAPAQQASQTAQVRAAAH